ncbi:hypothetical protein ACSVDA_02375 [Cytobacillus sp. Hm23]
MTFLYEMHITSPLIQGPKGISIPFEVTTISISHVVVGSMLTVPFTDPIVFPLKKENVGLPHSRSILPEHWSIITGQSQQAVCSLTVDTVLPQHDDFEAYALIILPHFIVCLWYCMVN